jgi:hydroxymethylbilane synthase
MTLLRIATRESELALWQARFVAERLEQCHPDLKTELVPMTTRGDQLLDRPLAQIGGKGLFLKELEQALIEGRADIAVHSMKDVPADMPDGLEVPVVLERHDPRDAFVSHNYGSLEDMPEGALVGTSSLRRQSQVMRRHPRLRVEPLRGNVQTRLRKLDEGQFDAILLACAGLDRLELSDRVRQRLSPETSLPAVAQGAIGIECRCQDTEVRSLIDPLNHATTAIAVSAERGFSAELGGSCQVPLGAYATTEEGQVNLTGMVAMPDGSELILDQQQGPASQAEALGRELARTLIAQGANRILASL